MPIKQAVIKSLSIVVIGTAACCALLVGAAQTVLAAASVPPAPSMIRVENKLSGTPDVITVTGLSAGDNVKIYADGGAALPLGTAAVASSSNSVNITISQLGITGGHVYVTVTQPGYSESRRIVKSYLAEPLSVAPSASSIRVTNKPTGMADTVAVFGLHTGDTVQVYTDAAKTSLLGTAVAASGSSEGTVIPVGQLGIVDGIVYVAVTETGRRESKGTEKAYAGEAQTDKPHLGQIRITNELHGTSDHVIVSGLLTGDILKVYATEKEAVPLAQAAVASGSDTADAVIPQLGLSGGNIYLSVTRNPLQESVRVSKQFKQEPISPSPAPGMIEVTNEPLGMDDKIEVFGVSTGDTINVYASADASSPVGTATVGSDAVKAVITISQLGREAGFVYVTVASTTLGESRRVAKSYAAELASSAPERSDIRVVNAVGPLDTVTLSGLQSGDTIKVYGNETSDQAIGSGTVADGASTAVISTALPEKGFGIVYITVTRPQEEESARTPKIYAAEPITLPLTANQIRVSNLAGAAGNDEITAIAVKSGDTIKLYADATTVTPFQTLAGQNAIAVVAEGTTTATIGGLQLNGKGGRVYVTVTSQGKHESSRIVKAYEAE